MGSGGAFSFPCSQPSSEPPPHGGDAFEVVGAGALLPTMAALEMIDMWVFSSSTSIGTAFSPSPGGLAIMEALEVVGAMPAWRAAALETVGAMPSLAGVPLPAIHGGGLTVMFFAVACSLGVWLCQFSSLAPSSGQEKFAVTAAFETAAPPSLALALLFLLDFQSSQTMAGGSLLASALPSSCCSAIGDGPAGAMAMAFDLETATPVTSPFSAPLPSLPSLPLPPLHLPFQSDQSSVGGTPASLPFPMALPLSPLSSAGGNMPSLPLPLALLPLPGGRSAPCSGAPSGPVTLTACSLPVDGFVSTSNSTSSPSAKDLNPSPKIDEWCRK
mmetsp:Transcript_92801/g.290473  ORF Transcript_92801/g.290473 Transcript_92801/m.290473 type:complete len:329 (+) Transcript_92801:609-1595(+)